MGEDERQIGVQNGGRRLAQAFPSLKTSHQPSSRARRFHLIEVNSPLDCGNRTPVTSLEVDAAATEADFVSAHRGLLLGRVQMPRH
jgi:hypothetical protein